MDNLITQESFTFFYNKRCDKTNKILEIILQNGYKVIIVEHNSNNIDSEQCIGGYQPEKIIMNDHNIIGYVETPAIFHDDGYGLRTIYRGDDALIWINCHFSTLDELKTDSHYLKVLSESIDKNIKLRIENDKIIELKKKRSTTYTSIVICNEELSKILMRDALVKENLVKLSKLHIAADVISISKIPVHITDKTIYSNSYSGDSCIRKIKTNHETGFHTIVVVDFDNININDEFMKELLLNGHMYNCIVLCITTTIPNIQFSLRNNFDYIYVDRGKNPSEHEMKKLHQHYFGVYETCDAFINQYNRTVKNPDDYITLSNSHVAFGKISDVVGKYRPYKGK